MAPRCYRIVSSKITERYYRPSVLISVDGEELKVRQEALKDLTCLRPWFIAGRFWRSMEGMNRRPVLH